MHNLHFIIHNSNYNNMSNINNKISFLFNTIELQYASVPVSRLDYDMWWISKYRYWLFRVKKQRKLGNNKEVWKHLQFGPVSHFCDYCSS